MKETERYELQEIFEDGSFHWCLKDNDTKLLNPWMVIRLVESRNMEIESRNQRI